MPDLCYLVGILVVLKGTDTVLAERKSPVARILAVAIGVVAIAVAVALMADVIDLAEQANLELESLSGIRGLTW